MAAIVIYSINARALGQPLACLQCESKAAAADIEQAYLVGNEVMERHLKGVYSGDLHS